MRSPEIIAEATAVSSPRDATLETAIQDPFRRFEMSPLLQQLLKQAEQLSDEERRELMRGVAEMMKPYLPHIASASHLRTRGLSPLLADVLTCVLTFVATAIQIGSEN